MAGRVARPTGWKARLADAVDAYARRAYGRPLSPTDAWAHRPLLAAGYGAFEVATERAGALELRLKDLAVLKAAMLVNCEWCMDIGSALARKAGLGERELRALPEYADSDVFTDDEKLVLDYAVGMSRTPAEVDDVLWERLRARFDEPQIVELTAAIAIENLRARFNNALGIEPQGFSEGSFCVVPSNGQ